MLKLGCINRILLRLSLGQKLFKDEKLLITQRLCLIDLLAFARIFCTIMNLWAKFVFLESRYLDPSNRHIFDYNLSENFVPSVKLLWPMLLILLEKGLLLNFNFILCPYIKYEQLVSHL